MPGLTVIESPMLTPGLRVSAVIGLTDTNLELLELSGTVTVGEGLTETELEVSIMDTELELLERLEGWQITPSPYNYIHKSYLNLIGQYRHAGTLYSHTL